MNKAPEKVTKDPKRVEAAHKGREKCMNKLKERILNDVKQVVEILPMQAIKLPVPLPIQAIKLPALPTPPPQDQIILIPMVLVYLLSLPLVFAYFLHITLSLKIKNVNEKQDQQPIRRPMLYKNLCNKISDCEDCQKKNNDGATPTKKLFGYGLIITTIAATTAVIFFGLRLVGMRKGNALLTSMSLIWFMSLPVCKM